jgi:hypothetical protein
VALKVLCIVSINLKSGAISSGFFAMGSDCLKRANDTTAATRLFDRKFPDLFSWLLDEMNAPSLPRKSR